MISSGVQLVKVPMPPSINKQLMVSKGRMIKTNEARKYDRAFDVYLLMRQKAIAATKDLIRQWQKDGFNALRVDIEFFFPKEKLFSKNNMIKKLDTTNRVKSVLDKISLALEIDDSLFIETFATKTLCDSEHCTVTIFPKIFTKTQKL
jgi:Holliday junction resolvase RusA-like endonuclease